MSFTKNPVVLLTVLAITILCSVTGQRNRAAKLVLVVQGNGSQESLSLFGSRFIQPGAHYLRTCRSPGTPFASLDQALQAQEQYQQHGCAVDIVLNATTAYNCVIATGMNSTLELVGRQRFTIDLDDQSDCKQADLRQQFSNDSNVTSFAISHSENIAMRRVRFSEVTVFNLSGEVAVSLFNSTNISFTDCIFRTTQLRPSFNITDSRQIRLEGNAFIGASGADRYLVTTTDWIRKQAKPIVNVLFTGNRSESLATGRGQGSSLDVLIVKCKFDCLGPNYYVINLLELSSDEVSGVAIRVSFVESAAKNMVEVRESTFLSTWSPRDSALFVDYLGEKNTVSVQNCTFTHGWAFLGAAVFANFSGDEDTTRMNSLFVNDSIFHRNRARQEGAAVLIRFAGSQKTNQHNNCVRLQNCLFENNVAGDPEEAEKPGVVFVISERKVLSFEPGVFYSEGKECERPVELDSCTFRNNTVLGAFYGRNAMALFSRKHVRSHVCYHDNAH